VAACDRTGIAERDMLSVPKTKANYLPA